MMNDSIKDQATYWAACQQEGLTKKQQNDFENWIMQNPKHKIAFNDAENLYNIFQNIPRSYTKEASKLTHKNLKRKRIYNVIQPYFAYAAAFLIIFLFSYKTYDYFTPTFEAHYVANNDMQSTVLPDGSIITLDNKTHLDVTFYNNSRHVVLNSGQAFFDVAPNKEKVFSIKVNNVYIEVVGTSFEVQKNEHNTEVNVAEGIVKVSRLHANYDKKTMLGSLLKGDTISINDKGKVLVYNKVLVKNIAAWREHKLIFDNNSLKEAFHTFSKYNDFELESELDLSTILFSGSFQEKEIDKFLDVLKNIYSFQIKQQNNKIILSKM